MFLILLLLLLLTMAVVCWLVAVCFCFDVDLYFDVFDVSAQHKPQKPMYWTWNVNDIILC